MNKIIVFDLGGVLIDWNPEYLYTSYFETEEAMRFFLTTICTSDWNEEQDGGRPLDVATALLIDQYPEYSKEIKAFYTEWETMLGGTIEGTVDILQSLRKSHDKVYALTNWSAETFPIAQQRYDFLGWFDGILVSGEENLKKPDPKIYQLLLSKFELNAEDCLFIDDNLRNVHAAIQEGIDTIHFKNPAQLKTALSQKGIQL